MDLKQESPDIKNIPGGWKPETNINLDLQTNIKTSTPLKDVIVIENFLSENDISKLINLMKKAPKLEAVGINGLMDNKEETNIGSKRVTMWTLQASSEIWRKLDHIGILEDVIMDPYTSTDWWQGDKLRYIWKPVAASPMMRFMKYENMGQHYSHYDAGYIYKNDNYRTLMSYVIYLTDCEDGGRTRFIKDNQNHLKVWDRIHTDWTRQALEEEVIYAQKPKKGTIMLFNHRLCHDVEQYKGDNPRIIIRGDIIFEAQTKKEQF